MNRISPIYLSLALAVLSQTLPASAVAGNADDEKLEKCVNMLRNSPVIFKGSFKFDDYEFSQIWVPGREISAKFNSCVADAASATSLKVLQNNKFSTRFTDFTDVRHKNPGNLRYLFSNSYQRAYLLDVVEKRSYELVRIPPPGSIEDSGNWNGEYKDPLPGCSNDWGDPCGTKYKWDDELDAYVRFR